MQLGTRSSTHLIHPVRQRRLWPRPSSSHASRIHEIVTPLSTGYTCPVTIRASLPRRARGTSSCAESQVRNRLSAGGRWIRTSGPGTKEPVFLAEGELRDRARAAKKGCFFMRYRWFESISLQRGVHCETDFCRQSLLSGGLPAAGSSLITIQESLLRSRLI